MSASVSLVRTPFWHMRKPGIQSCENVPDAQRPFILPPKCAFTQTQTFEPDVLQLFLWDLFIILSLFLAGSCSVKMPQAFHDPSINFHCAWEGETHLKCAFISTQTFEVDVSRSFLLALILILSFLPKLTVKRGKSSRPKIGQQPAVLASYQPLLTVLWLALSDKTLLDNFILALQQHFVYDRSLKVTILAQN